MRLGCAGNRATPRHRRGRRRHPTELPPRHVPRRVGSRKRVYTGIPFAADLDAQRARRRGFVGGTVAVVDAYSEHFGVFRFAEEVLAEGPWVSCSPSSAGSSCRCSPSRPRRSPTTGSTTRRWARALDNLGLTCCTSWCASSGPSPKRPACPPSTSAGGTSSTARGGSMWRSPTPRWRPCALSPGPSGSHRGLGAAAAPGFHLESPATVAASCLTRRMPSGESTFLVGRAGGALRGGGGPRPPAHDQGHRPAERVAGRPGARWRGRSG